MVFQLRGKHNFSEKNTYIEDKSFGKEGSVVHLKVLRLVTGPYGFLLVQLHCLKAMGVNKEWAMGTCRFTVGRESTLQEAGQGGKDLRGVFRNTF